MASGRHRLATWLDHPGGEFRGLEIDAAGAIWLFGDGGALVQRPAP